MSVSPAQAAETETPATLQSSSKVEEVAAESQSGTSVEGVNQNMEDATTPPSHTVSRLVMFSPSWRGFYQPNLVRLDV